MGLYSFQAHFGIGKYCLGRVSGLSVRKSNPPALAGGC